MSFLFFYFFFECVFLYFVFTESPPGVCFVSSPDKNLRLSSICSPPDMRLLYGKRKKVCQEKPCLLAQNVVSCVLPLLLHYVKKYARQING